MGDANSDSGSVRAFLLGLIEGASYASIRWVLHPRAPFLFYRETVVDDLEYRRYLRERDPLLGWPRLNQLGTVHYDSSGARPTVWQRNLPACVSLYGDSYTYGFEVAAEEAWGSVLSEFLECRVANYGVAGYGTDQAYLRFRRNEFDQARLIILGIYHENIVRVVNQYRFLINAGDPFTFKPRMRLEGSGMLTEIPLPVDDLTDIGNAIRFPRRHLTEEWFLPETPEGPVRVTFPFSVTIFRALNAKRVRNWLRNEPSWIDFYDPNHPSHALPTMVAVVRAFADLAAERQREFLVVIFPAPSSIRFHRERGENAAQSLKDSLATGDIKMLDLIELIPALLEGKSYCDILTARERCQGHFNRQGNQLVAEIIHDYVRGSSALIETDGKIRSK